MSTEVTGPMTSPLLARPGAVAADGPDAGVAAHYGDPMREQRRLLAGEAIVDLSHREVLSVAGVDRLRWLHSMTTQHLVDAAAGESIETLVLSPKGHIEHALHLVDDGSTTWITVEPGSAATLLAWLESMRFMLRVEVLDRTGEYAVLAGVPSAATAELASHAVAVWTDPWPGLVGDTTAYGPVEGHPAADWHWCEWLVPRADLVSIVGDRALAGVWAAEALRVAAWRPRAGFDTDSRTIVHELDWLRSAVHLHKGCYRGQETVARVHNLGRPPRRLVFLPLDGSGHVLPERGEPVLLDGRAVGVLTSVARHFEQGPIGLAVVKRSTPVDAELAVGDVSAAQTVVVDPGDSPVRRQVPRKIPRPSATLGQ